MNVVEIVIIIFTSFMCVYAIIDRICKCVEYRHTSKTVEEMMNKTQSFDMNKILNKPTDKK